MGDLQGWQADPFGRHEMRYYSRGEPTEFVRDGTRESSDPPPSSPGAAGLPAESGPSALAPAVAAGGRRSHSKRKRARGVIVIAVVLLAGLGTALGVLTSHHGPSAPGSGMSPAAFLTSATHTTLSRRSVDITLSGTVAVSGQTVKITGSAQADLSARTVTDEIGGSIDGVSIAATGRLVGQDVYMAETLNGRSLFSAIAPDKTWLELPIPLVSASGSLGMGAGDPIGELQTLAQAGNTVSAIGTSKFGGVEMSGFSVTVSRQNISAAIAQAIAGAGLSPSLRGLLEKQMNPAMSTMREQIRVWVDPSGLVRRMTIDLAGFPPDSESVEVTGTYSNYGASMPPVVAPPASDVISLGSYMQAALSKAAASAA